MICLNKMQEKHLRKSVMTWNLTKNVTLSKMFFMHFTKENHLLFFYKDQPSDRKELLRKLFEVSVIYSPKDALLLWPW